jgi:hypothetical protein
MQEISVGCADIRNIKEVAAGVTHLSGVIQAGRPGRENSWKIYAMADVQVRPSIRLTTVRLKGMIVVYRPDHYSTTEIYDKQCGHLEE